MYNEGCKDFRRKGDVTCWTNPMIHPSSRLHLNLRPQCRHGDQTDFSAVTSKDPRVPLYCHPSVPTPLRPRQNEVPSYMRSSPRQGFYQGTSSSNPDLLNPPESKTKKRPRYVTILVVHQVTRTSPGHSRHPERTSVLTSVGSIIILDNPRRECKREVNTQGEQRLDYDRSTKRKERYDGTKFSKRTM